jgi:hypothetical protein
MMDLPDESTVAGGDALQENDADDATGAVDGQADVALETDLQVQDATAAIEAMDDLFPGAWQTLDAGDRLTALQDVVDQMAAIQGRPGVKVVPGAMPQGAFGAFDGEQITVNAAHLEGDMPVGEFVDTIVHEGRHAYQAYAVEHPGAVTDSALVASWAENMAPGNYLNAEQYGQELYQNQPIEADAWSYAGRITANLGLPRLAAA